MSPKINLSPNSKDSGSYRNSGSASGEQWQIQKRLNVSLQGKISAVETSLEVSATEIALKASKTYVDGQDSNLQSQITVQAGQISLKVSKDSVISAINLSTEGITISAAKIDLSGYVTITNIGNGTTSIDGSNIKTGYISANRIAADTITASHLNISSLSLISPNAGTITGGSVAAWTITPTELTGAAGVGGTTYLNKNGHFGFFGDENSGHVIATYGGTLTTDTGIRVTTEEGRGAVFGSGEPFSSLMAANGGKPEVNSNVSYVDLQNTQSGGKMRLISDEIQLRPQTLEGIRSFRDNTNYGYGQNMQLKRVTNTSGTNITWYDRYFNGILISSSQTEDTSGLYTNMWA